jgi:hypothetical protein
MFYRKSSLNFEAITIAQGRRSLGVNNDAAVPAKQSCRLRHRLFAATRTWERPTIMSKRRVPWFWNSAVLLRLAGLLLAALFAVHATRMLAQWGWVP